MKVLFYAIGRGNPSGCPADPLNPEPSALEEVVVIARKRDGHFQDAGLAVGVLGQTAVQRRLVRAISKRLGNTVSCQDDAYSMMAFPKGQQADTTYVSVFLRVPTFAANGFAGEQSRPGQATGGCRLIAVRTCSSPPARMYAAPAWRHSSTGPPRRSRCHSRPLRPGCARRR